MPAIPFLEPFKDLLPIPDVVEPIQKGRSIILR